MSAISSSTVNPDDMFTPVVDYAGVVSSPALRRLRLGIVASYDVLCCIECPQLRLLKLSTAPSHAHTHMTNKRAHSANSILALCSKYNVYNGRCLLCEDVGVQYAVESADTMANHFTKQHKEEMANRKGGLRPEKAATVQTFCTFHHTKKWFQVFPQLAGPPDPEDLHSSPATAREMLRSVIRSWRPVEHAPVSVSSVKEVQPWLHFNGWVGHTSRYDPAFLCSLVGDPEEGSPLARIAAAATREFERDQGTLSNTAFVYRTEVMDEGNGPPKHEFRRLEEATAREYGRCWALFVVFVMRLRRMELEGDDRYTVTMTPSQKRCVDRAWKYAEKGKDRPTGRRALLDMSRWFWCPDTMEDFAHLAVDQFDDPTVRFGILINMRADGSFSSPGNASHLLVRIKYFMRAALFMWSRDTQQRKKLPREQEQQRGKLTEPAEQHSGEHRASTDQAMLVAVLVDVDRGEPGKPVRRDQHTRAERVVDDANAGGGRGTRHRVRGVPEGVSEMEQLLKKLVLLGITLEDYGFNVTEKTTIYDSHGRTDAGYSMFSDDRNPFRGLEWAMAKVLFEREEGSGLHRGTDEKGDVCWVDGAVERWLEDYAECTRQHAFLMHLSGGQSSRGVEFCLMKAKNTTHRPRNFHWVNPGTLLYLLYYGKGTNTTGMDRVVAHAVPWRLAQTFLVLHGLVNPFASMLVQRLAGDAASYVQQTSAFAVMGKELVSDQLSGDCGRFFQTSLKVKVRLRVLRQFLVSCGRQMMPEAFAPMQQASNIVDSQAGHNTETALGHYGILVGEHRLFMHNTILKYIEASKKWWTVLWPEGTLLPEEAQAGTRAPGRLAQLSIEGPDAPSVGRSGPSLDKEELADAIRKVMKEGPLAEFVAGQVTRAMGDLQLGGGGGNTSAPARPAAGSNDGPRREGPSRTGELGPEHEATKATKATKKRVDVNHLAALRIYTGDRAGEWKSRGQGQAFLHALGRETSVLAVLPTGGGKSAVFGAATVLESGLTVVITPLRALLLDQARSLESRGVSTSMWNGDRQAGPPDGVVLTSVEAAASKDFPQWLLRLHAEKRLNRIVVDEVHLVKLSKEYREAMSGLSGLVQAGVPLVGLSATVPPSSEEEIRRLLGRPSWCVVREPTQRANLGLRIAEFRDSKTADRSLQMHVERYRSELEDGEGILVQCRTYADVEHIGKLLGALQYRKNMSEEERDGNAKDWLEGRSTAIVGTSGMGTGVHHRACRAVLHYKLPYGIVDYAQETGRAGRDGRAALCIIFAPRPAPGAPDVDAGGWEQLKEMAEGTGCMRMYSSRHLDGEELETTCAELGGELCSRCKASMGQIVGRNGAGLSMPGIPEGSKKRYSADEWIEEHLPTFKDRDQGPAGTGPSEAAAESTPRAEETEEDSTRRAGATVLRSTSASDAPGPSTTRLGQTTQQEQVRRASATAACAAPIGPRVTADAAAAQTRESARMDAEAATEVALAPLNFPTLMEVKKKMEQRCVWCALHRTSSLGHPMYQCQYAPGGGAWSLDAHGYKGVTFKEAKTVHELPVNRTVCFMCWWSLTHDHRSNRLGCVGRDQVLQLCWLVLCDDKLRESLRGAFKLEEELEDGYAYVRWLSQTVREVQWYGTEQTLVVGHLVMLWALYKEKKVFHY
ncbi:hypothetical protein FRC10_009647 [Ceratobasidium sp. 414]|nr:hypothetical protein FRC10_009647 [Ceratobasidium sp. 414]